MNTIERIASDRGVSQALESFETDLQTTIDLAIGIQQIPAPTFSEDKRAAHIETLFEDVLLEDVRRDGIHNVYGRHAGRDARPPVVVSAHMDTVFPVTADLRVRYDGHGTDAIRIYGPGLADNSLGVAGLVTLARTLEAYGLRTKSDIWLVANVAEEGLGNLQGMRAVVDNFDAASTYLVVEGGSFGHVFHEAVGVRRYLIEVQTPGGHSWGDFGKPNAIHILGELVAAISNMEVPPDPKTTFNIGVIEGGTTINAIASSAKCQLDLRSLDDDLLNKLTNDVRELVDAADSQANTIVEMTRIGERPSGRLPRDMTVVKMAADALKQVGYSQVEFMAGSTDASVPISLGLPAVCIGLAKSGNTHRLDEFVDITCLSKGLSQLLLLTLAIAGFEGT
jgi:acetylornithine deacetylase/succinyl-diaminopimelate desuccinylase-like protein